MDAPEIILAVVGAWALLGLVAARFCAMNTISEENDRRIIDAAAAELREDMASWPETADPAP